MYLRISYVQGLCRLRLWLYLNWRNYGQRHLGHWRRTSGCQRQEWTGATVWICLNCELITYRPMILRMSNSFMQFTWVSHLYADLFCKIIFGWNVSGWSSWEWGWSSDLWDTGRSWGNSGDPHWRRPRFQWKLMGPWRRPTRRYLARQWIFLWCCSSMCVRKSYYRIRSWRILAPFKLSHKPWLWHWAQPYKFITLRRYVCAMQPKQEWSDGSNRKHNA